MTLDEATVNDLVNEIGKRCRLFLALIDGVPGDTIPKVVMSGDQFAILGASTVLADIVEESCRPFHPAPDEDVDTDDDD